MCRGTSRRCCWPLAPLANRPQRHLRLRVLTAPPVHRTNPTPDRSFKKAVEKGEVDEQEQKRQHARQSLERYMHYWQRWAENDSSRKKARAAAGGGRGWGGTGLGGGPACVPAAALPAGAGRAASCG